MAKIDLAAAPRSFGARYPAPFDAPCAGRSRTALGDAGGLTDFGVNLLRLAPGAWSSQRHWHDCEDEFVHVLSGEVVLVTDQGETHLRAGDSAAFPKGVANGHHRINRGSSEAVVLEVGTRTAHDVTVYPDIDLRFDPQAGGYVNKDGAPYPEKTDAT